MIWGEFKEVGPCSGLVRTPESSLCLRVSPYLIEKDGQPEAKAMVGKEAAATHTS